LEHCQGHACLLYRLGKHETSADFDVVHLLLHSSIHTCVIAGSLADKYGGKPVLTAGVALWSLFTVITPQAAAAGTAPLIAARVLLGVGEGVAFPAIHSMIGAHDPLFHHTS
jgi:MFS family permease